MKLKKLSLRERKLVTLGGIAAALIILVIMIILPFVENRQRVKQEIATKMSQLRQYTKTVQEKESLVAKKAELTQRMERIGTKLLSETVPSAATNTLQQIADELLKGVDVGNRRPVKEERLKEDYQKVGLQVDFQCQIEQLVPVLYEIKKFDRYYLSLDTLEITYQQYAVKAKDAKIKPLRVGLTLSTIIRYMAPEKKEDKDTGRGKTAAGPAKA